MSAGDHLQPLERNTLDTINFVETTPPEKHDFRYAEGKWSMFSTLLTKKETPVFFLKPYIKCAVIRLACSLLLLLLARVAEAERLPLKPYSVADGLPNNIINKIVRDSRGFLWICTDEGLSLFDGYQFINYGESQGLPHPIVRDILETREGAYWVATNGGLCQFNPRGVGGDNQELTNGPTAARDSMFSCLAPDGDDRYTKNITTLLQSHDGTVWCGTRRGLFRLTRAGGRAVLEPVNINLPTEYPLSGFVTSLLQDRYETIWIGAATGLYRLWPDGKSARYGTNDGLPDENIHDLLEDRHGNLWVATRLGGLIRLAIEASPQPPVITRIYNHQNGLTTDWVFDIHESADGKLWIGTNRGLVEFPADVEKQASPSHVFTESNGFSYHEILNVMEDSEGNLWLGSINGAMKIARNGFLTFGAQDGIFSIFSVFEPSGDELYAYGYVFGDQNASVFEGGKLNVFNPGPHKYWLSLGRFDGERFTWLMPRAVRDVEVSWSDKPFIIKTRADEWWIGQYLFPQVRNFVELKSARPITIHTAKVEQSVVYTIYESSKEDVWLSTTSPKGNGLFRWERATGLVQDLTGTEGLPALKETLPVSFQEDQAANIWVGFSEGVGLARYSAGRFTLFTTSNGLPPGSISDLYLDREGRLWVATTRGGIARVDVPTATAPTFINYSAAQGLSSNFTNAITEDLQGRIYVGTGRGLDRLTPATGRIKHFTTVDGLAPGKILTAFGDHLGVVWIGTTEGLSRFVPELEEPARPPPILINGLRLAGEMQSVSPLGETEITLPELPSNRNQLQIDFVGLSFASGETLRYQHRLEGVDADWSELTDQRTVNYASLSPGKYKFLVQALNSDGVFSSRPASVSFTILPPVWLRWWFVSLAIVLGGLTFSTLYRYRVGRILEVTNMRERIATDLHDDIGANLTKITLLSEVVRQQLGDDKEISGREMSKPLSAIARISRESVAAMSDIVWAINPQRDSFRDLVRRMRPHAEEIFTLRGINLTFNAPGDARNLRLGADVRRDLFLFFKEAVNNAARHSHCTRVEIELRAEGSWIMLSVADNGVGFDPLIDSSGQGLAGMRRRAEGLGGSVKIDTGAGRGTKVQLRIPINARARH